jgi:phosphorylase kinase alpha/beta subunit
MTIPEKAQEHLNNIRNLQAPTGLFLAAARDVSTGYDKAWLRDNFYMSLGFEAAREMETVKKIWRAILDIFLKHQDKISWAANYKPHATWQYIHARYNPETFEEYWEEWGNKQNDAIGAILWKLADLETMGVNVIETDEDKKIVQRLVDYLNAVEYWNDSDNGIWEEYEEVHASSVAACVAGLRKLSALPFITIHEDMIEKGEETLFLLLPRESDMKFADMALLSLMYPYDILGREMSDIILENIEYHLVKSRGVFRYKTDKYYNKNKKDGWSEEAEWTMGFPWLAIIYARRGDIGNARRYLELAEAAMTRDGKLPELYYSNSGKPNENTPLGWAESLYVVALLEMEKLSVTS